jgi:prepilin-type N-terminal cleavage/methylation domain-containing protein
MRKAFTLFEIMIVLIIISIVYGVVFSAISKSKNRTIKVKPTMIKHYMLNQEFENSIEVICLKNGLKSNLNTNLNCILYSDEVLSKSSFKSPFGADSEVYIYKENRLEQIDFNDIEIDDKMQEVSFKLKIKKPQNNQELIIKYEDDKILYIHPYFSTTKVFENLSDVEEYLSNNQRLVDAI